MLSGNPITTLSPASSISADGLFMCAIRDKYIAS